MPDKPLTVLVVDDSALVRQMLVSILSSDPEIGTVEVAPDPLIARDKIKRLNPDVITLDIEMPRMNGMDFLDKIMALRPMPVVMLSSLTQRGADAAIMALEHGAVDFVPKPVRDLAEGFDELRDEILTKVKAAARANVARRLPRPPGSPVAPARLSYRSTETIVAIGASTGGVEALADVLAAMPGDAPAVVVTQHMPPAFTRRFAERLDGLCRIRVVEAEDGARILPGHAYIAPGGFQLEVVRSGADYRCRVLSAERVSGHCPSVDVLFHSVAEAAGANAVGVIMTGMGRDGAAGLLAMRRAGARTLGQDEATCLVYGMPRVASEIGAVERQAPLEAIAQSILDLVGSRADRAIRV